MKRFLSMALVLCMILGLVPAVSAAETVTDAEAAVAALNAGSDFYYELVDKYDESEIEYRTEVRWWMAEGGHTDETLIEEVQAMYNAGFRGVELCQLNVSGMDGTVWGYGSEQWDHDFQLVLNTALDLGMTVGITSGTNWSTSNIPGLNPDSQSAMQCVLTFDETVKAGTGRSGAIPTSKITTSGCGGTSTVTKRDAASFIGAYAYKIVDSDAKPIRLDQNPLNLTDQIVVEENGDRSLEWTAPADADYLIHYCWQQGTAQEAKPAVTPSYCINYLDKRGFEAWTAYYAAHVLNDPELNEKIKNGDVQLFMDSLEYSFGNGITLYSEEFAEEFEARKGYDIRPYLLLAEGLPSLTTWNEDLPTYGKYDLTDAELGQKIRNDLHDVQTQLYMENLLEPMREWLHGYGITLRAQISYGKYLEISEPALEVDYPEAENLNQRNQIDYYRLWTGGAKLENKILSSETGALDGMSYGYEFQTNMMEAYHLYAAGFSRINWHIWSSQWAPKDLWTTGSQKWPGFQSMAFFQTWGLREPAYEEYAEMNQHLGRVQKLLREGKARSDIGMIYTKYGQCMCPYASREDDMWMQRHEAIIYPSTELQENGYTYDYFSPEFLKDDGVYYDAENGTLEQAGYKALVLWQDCLDLEGAQMILDLAKQGLKVVVVDGAAVKTTYNEDDAALVELMAELKTLENVRTAASIDDVMETLQAMGVEPYTGFQSRQLLTQVREDENGNRFLYAFNYCDGSLHDGNDEEHGVNLSEDIVMEGTFIPYYIDAWSGEVTQVADYRWEDGKTVFTLDLNFRDIALYAFEAVEAEPEHVVASELETYVTEDGIVVRATESGTYKTELAYGRTVRTTVDVPEAFDITGWDVTVESWEEGELITREDTFVDSNSVRGVEQTVSTVKRNIAVKLDKLTTWDNIPEVGKDISGRGYYKATFNWDTNNADGAYLDFGVLSQALEVYINGEKTADLNMNTPIMDIGDYLKDGENTIELVYGSTMTNALLAKGYLKVRYANHPTSGFGDKLWLGYSVDYRANGPAQAVVVPYVEQNISVLENNDVTVNVTGKTDVTVDLEELTYDVTVSGAENLATATLTFEVNGVADAAVKPAEGWTVYAQTYENGVLTAVLGNLTGVSGEATIATVAAETTGKTGTASVELTDAELSAYVGDSETFVNVIYGNVSVETVIDYSVYDVNRDGKVNQLDITRAQRYYGTDDEICDVDNSGEVNIADLILILNNYTK